MSLTELNAYVQVARREALMASGGLSCSRIGFQVAAKIYFSGIKFKVNSYLPGSKIRVKSGPEATLKIACDFERAQAGTLLNNM